MEFLQGIGLVGNLAAFAAAAAIAWWGGDRLARAADALTERTRAGQALVGVVLLGVMVSLPELTFAAVAAAFGNAALAVNALLGGVAMVMVMVAVTDLVVGPEPLSRDVQHPVVMLQGALTILMLVTVGAGITVGDRPLPGIGLAGIWTTLLLVLYAIALLLVRSVQRRHPWRPDSSPPDDAAAEGSGRRRSKRADSARSIALRLGTSAAAVVFAGTVMAFTADAITAQTAIGAGLIGFLFGGISTSLPELSTTISSARLGRYEMAFADAFGTNLCSIALLFLADVIYPGPPILNEVGRFSLFAVMVGAGVTAIYLVGLVARPRRPVLRMGPDSVAVLAVAAAGFVILASLQ